MATTNAVTMDAPWQPIADLADVAAIEAVPFDRRVPFRSTYELLQSAGTRFADRPALTVMPTGAPSAADRTYSYRDLLDIVTRSANLFRALGMERDDSISILLPNIAEFQFAMWAGEAAGRANPINPLLDADAIAAMVRAAGSRILITLPPGHPSGLFEKALSACPHDVTLMVTSDAPPDGSAVDFSARLATMQGNALEFPLPDSKDAVASLYHTGGTTGRVKLVTHTHGNELANAWQTACCFAFTAADVIFNAAPLFHVTGTILLSLAPFLAGAHVVMGGPDGFRSHETIAAFWDIVAYHKVSVVCSVPTVYATLLNSPLEDRTISSLRFAICGAAPLPPSIAEAFEQRTGAAILEGYGMTETCSTSIVNPRDGRRKIGAVGIRAPYQDVRIAILDQVGQFKRDAEPGEAGALLMRGPNVTPGYLPAAANDQTRPISDWLDTGDTARIDEDGFVFLTGRRKDLIIRSGHNIDPAMVEHALAGHPDVAAVASVGKPDAYAGELPVAYVVTRPGAIVTENDLLTYARDRVAERPAAPSDIFFVEALPLTTVGKVYKPTLRLDAARRACGALLASTIEGRLENVRAYSDPARGLVVEVVAGGAPNDDVAEIVHRLLGPLPLIHELVWAKQTPVSRS